MTTEGQFTLNDLRTLLSDTIRKVQAGELTPSIANAQANLSGKILSSYKLQLDYHKYIGRRPNLPFLVEGEEEEGNIV